LIDKQAAMLEVARIHQEELNETNIAVQTENRGDRALANHSIED
jgi:Na+-transporting NADH:ubiquinone oxidoreductase subunit NqrC